MSSKCLKKSPSLYLIKVYVSPLPHVTCGGHAILVRIRQLDSWPDQTTKMFFYLKGKKNWKERQAKCILTLKQIEENAAKEDLTGY